MASPGLVRARMLIIVAGIVALSLQPAWASSEDVLTSDGVTAWLSTTARLSSPGICSGTTLVSTSPVGPDVLAVTVTTTIGPDCIESLESVEVVREAVEPEDLVVPAYEPREGGSKSDTKMQGSGDARRRTGTATAEEWFDESGGSDTLVASVHATQTFGYDKAQAYHFTGSTACTISNGRFVQDACSGQVENQGPGYAQYRGTLWTHDAWQNRFYHTLSSRSIAYPDGYVRAECYHTGDWTAASYMKCRST